MALTLAGAPALARAPQIVPKPRPDAGPRAKAESPHHRGLTDIPDMSKAVPASQIGTLPNTAERYKRAQGTRRSGAARCRKRQGEVARR